MKLFIKFALALLVLALSLPMWLKGPDGEPIMQLDDWLSVPSDGAALVEKASAVLNQLPLPESGSDVSSDDAARETFEHAPAGQFYRWQDENGVWHFSDKRPEGGESLAAEKLPSVSNSMPRVELVEKEPQAPEPTGTVAPMGSSITPSLPEGVSQEAIEEMLQEAHERRMGDQL